MSKERIGSLGNLSQSSPGPKELLYGPSTPLDSDGYYRVLLEECGVRIRRIRLWSVAI
jgi:hypothetical protein